MSAVGNLWLGEYERAADDYHRIFLKDGKEAAEEHTRAALKSLGIDPNEITDILSEMRA